MFSLAILITSVLLISAVCSMTEAAMLSLPLIKARVLVEGKRKGAEKVLYVKENIHHAVATIVILNNSINIIGSIFVGNRVAQMFGSQWLGITSAVLTFAIIVISEVIPKAIGEHHKVAVSLMSARPLIGLMLVSRPVVMVLSLLTRPFRSGSKFPKVTEDEIKIMLRLGRDAGTVETDEETLCNRVFKLNDLRASQMMKPIESIFALESASTLADVKSHIIDSPYSRIAVFEADRSNIIGVCQHRILLREIAKDNYSARVKEFMTRPIFVDESEKADGLLEKFQAYHQHLFVVRNKKKQNIGILTMEDVLEELFGEIYDEKDFSSKIVSDGRPKK
ncbi:MAG: hemolysin family protein [Candidatus Omnitrophota bacterium]